MSQITPDRILALKKRIKAECARRKYVGSVEDYSSTVYDYTDIPTVDNYISEEHYEKLAMPMCAINNNIVSETDGFGRIISEKDFNIMETYITAYETREITDMNPTDCAGSCTGTCTVTCTGGCGSGCSNTCTGTCSGGCSGGCSGCSGSCRGRCKGGCDGCSGSCSGSCSGGCSGSCDSGCSGACAYGCSGKCREGCSKGCSGTCTTGCGSCRGYCKSSTGKSNIYA